MPEGFSDMRDRGDSLFFRKLDSHGVMTKTGVTIDWRKE